MAADQEDHRRRQPRSAASPCWIVARSTEGSRRERNGRPKI